MTDQPIPVANQPINVFSGYDPIFLSAEHRVYLPNLSPEQEADTVRNPEHPDGLWPHAHYTVALCASRRMAWYSAANLDATLFQPVSRKQLTSYWRRERRVPKAQLTTGAWYVLSEKKLQRGHLTPADCMEWGNDPADAIRNANNTFYFSNAVPQIQRLNGREWGMLERYIGVECAKAGNGRLCVHTGPRLLPTDPVYIHQVEGQSLAIPELFWKVIWYLDPEGRLCRIGFIMSQGNLLKASGLLQPEPAERAARAPGPFEELGNYKTYQVGVETLQEQTGMVFKQAERNPYPETRPRELMLKEIDVPVSFTPATGQGVAERVAVAPAGKQNLRILVGLEL